MLTLADADAASLRPLNLGQLKSLMAYEAMMGGAPGSVTGRQPETEFLFGNRSRFNASTAAQRLAGANPVKAGEDTVPGVSAPVDVATIINSAQPRAFELLANSERILTRMAASIHRSSRYRLLSHVAWRQPVTATGDTYPVLLQAGDRFGDLYELDGTLTVSRARFLHVQTDLWFTEFASKYEQELPTPELVTEFSAATLQAYPNLVAVERTRGNYIPVQSHHMSISRRMRSSTLHYLDHPYFGVLVQIEAFTYEPEPSTE
ncbi:MAG: CsiV family protein, partial [Pseudomonadales bacterium]